MINTEVERTIYPIAAYAKEFWDMFTNNQVCILQAETGAGKSTWVPLQLLNAVEGRIVLTTPTTAAAYGLSNYVSSILHSEVGDIVGYQTGYDKNFSKNTRILYTTEGLELMKELHHNNTLENGVLIIDELQEWSINVETLVAWIKEKIRSGWKTKVILMSATMDAEAVSKFFDNAAVLKVPGRQYPITEYERRSKDFVNSVYEHANKGRNVLAFVPGKREIENTIKELKKANLDAIILPLHGDLPLSEQQKVFETTNKVKVIVATNVAQTSITINGIVVVVDWGLERHMENIDGLDTLTIGTISKSDYLQRKGRAGRTNPGIYIWCNDIPLSKLKEYPTPDIYTGNIDQIVLKLASVGVDAAKVNFFHQPPIEKIMASKKTLRTLGAFDGDNNISEIGHIMAQLPLSVRYARMIVEAEKLGVLEDVITIAALSEFGGIKQSNVSYSAFSKEIKSDLLAEFDCFNLVKQRIAEKDRKPFSADDPFRGVIEKNYYRVLELRSKLYDILMNIYGEIDSSKNRNDILKACASGLVEFLYIRESNGWYTNPNDSSKRKLNLYSTTLPSRYLLGLPRNISRKHMDERGQETLYLISSAIMIDPTTLNEIAPHLIHYETTKEYDYNRNEYIAIKTKYFGDVAIESTEESVKNIVEKREMLVSWLCQKTFSDTWELNPVLSQILSDNRSKIGSVDRAKEIYNQLLQDMSKNSLPNLKKAKNFHGLRV